jgi:hypothetical protein
MNFSSLFTLHNFTDHKKCNVSLYELLAVSQVTSFLSKKMFVFIFVFVKATKRKLYNLSMTENTTSRHYAEGFDMFAVNI